MRNGGEGGGGGSRKGVRGGGSIAPRGRSGAPLSLSFTQRTEEGGESSAHHSRGCEYAPALPEALEVAPGVAVVGHLQLRAAKRKAIALSISPLEFPASPGPPADAALPPTGAGVCVVAALR